MEVKVKNFITTAKAVEVKLDQLAKLRDSIETKTKMSLEKVGYGFGDDAICRSKVDGVKFVTAVDYFTYQIMKEIASNQKEDLIVLRDAIRMSGVPKRQQVLVTFVYVDEALVNVTVDTDPTDLEVL